MTLVSAFLVRIVGLLPTVLEKSGSSFIYYLRGSDPGAVRLMILHHALPNLLSVQFRNSQKNPLDCYKIDKKMDHQKLPILR
jgi:hypothetical protein